MGQTALKVQLKANQHVPGPAEYFLKKTGILLGSCGKTTKTVTDGAPIAESVIYSVPTQLLIYQ